MKEPSPWVMQVIAIPIGIAVASVVMLLWFFLTPLEDAESMFSPLVFLFSFLGIIVVHELIHAATHPRGGRSEHSILGFWPSRILFYAHYDGELTQRRFIAVLLMPLIVISFVPLLFAVVVRFAPGWLAFVSCFNALLACGDILGAGIVFFQVPGGAIVRNQGWWTYWKEQEKPAA